MYFFNCLGEGGLTYLLPIPLHGKMATFSLRSRKFIYSVALERPCGPHLARALEGQPHSAQSPRAGGWGSVDLCHPEPESAHSTQAPGQEGRGLQTCAIQSRSRHSGRTGSGFLQEREEKHLNDF